MKSRIKAKPVSWRKFFSFLKKAKLPWGHWILSSIIPFIMITVSIKLPTIEAEIAAGQIFDKSLVVQYIVMSVLVLLTTITSVYSVWVGKKFDKCIQKMTWNKLIRLPMKNFEETRPSELITRVTSDSVYVSELIGYIIQLIESVYACAFLVYELFSKSSVLALLVVPVFAFNFVVLLFVRKRGYYVGLALQDSISFFASFLSERLLNLRLIKSCCTENQECTEGEYLSESRMKAERERYKYQIFIDVIMELSGILLTAFVLIGGGVMYSNGSIKLSDLIAFYLLSATAPSMLQGLLFQFLKLQEFRGCVDVITRLSDFESEDLQKGESTKSLENCIEFKDVSFSYDASMRNVLKDINFAVPKGKTTAIIGPSGSGKTTLLKLLERFYSPNSGKILYDGKDIETFSFDTWRKRFGYIVQNSPLITGTIRSNMLYGAKRDFTDEELVEIAKKVQLYEFISGLDDGFDTVVEGNGENLSGGQRQRIAIARALVAEPEILIMDEATSNLDIENASEIGSALRELMKDKTVVVVAHQMNTIRNADNIVIISDGKVEDIGTHDDLIKKDNCYSHYCAISNV